MYIRSANTASSRNGRIRPHALGGYMPTVVREVYERVQNSPMPNLPIYWTEWNTQYGKPGMAITWTHNPSVDMHFAASSVMKNVLEPGNLAIPCLTGRLPICLKKQAVLTAVSCTYGLLTIHGVKKATYNAYKLLRKLRTTIDDAMDAAGLPLIGVVPDDENIVISTNQGEPLVGNDTMAGKAYMNICHRLIGEDVPYLDLNVKKGIFSKLFSKT